MFEKIKEIILEFAEPDFEISEKTELKNDLGLSSFELVCIGERLSDITKADITGINIRKCVTVGDLCLLTEEA